MYHQSLAYKLIVHALCLLVSEDVDIYSFI